MRVLAVSTWLPTRRRPQVGAFVLRDARAIADQGHEVALIHLIPTGDVNPAGALAAEASTLAGLPVTRIVMSTTNPRQIAAAGHRLARWSVGADVVHTMAFSTLLALSWWRPAASWVHTEHWSGLTSPHLLTLPTRATLPALRPLLRRPDVVTAVTPSLADTVRDIRAEQAVEVVPCIVDRPATLGPRRAGRQDLHLVSVGALIERKDPLMAVDTVAELLSRGIRAQLRFVGVGPLARDITRRAADLGISKRVHMLGGRDRAGVFEELARADVFIGPTRGENFFVACAEAVLAGRPVVVGARGGHPAYLDDRVSVCVADQHPAAYADAVQRVLGSAADLSAEQISATLGERFAATTVAGGYLDAYHHAAARSDS